MGYVGVGTAWGFKKQTAFGSPATVDKWIPFISESIAQSYDMLEIVDSQSRHKKDNLPLGRKRVEGDINTYVEATNVGYPLYFLMGSVSAPVSGGIGVWEHTFEVADEVSYFTQEAQYGTFTTKGKRSFDNKMKSASFDFSDQMLTATWGTHGADYSGSVTPAAITYPTGRKFNFKDCGVTITPSGASSSGVKIRSGNLTLDNGLITDDYYQGRQTVQQLDAGKFSAKGSLEFIFDSATGLNDWLEGKIDAKVVIEYSGDKIAGTSQLETIKFTIPNCWANTHDVNMTNNEVILRNVEFEAYRDANGATAEDKGVVILLRNGFSTNYST